MIPFCIAELGTGLITGQENGSIGVQYPGASWPVAYLYLPPLHDWHRWLRLRIAPLLKGIKNQ